MQQGDPRTGRPYRRNKERLRRSGSPCCICGQPIDRTLRFPHPLSFSVHHLVAITRGGKREPTNERASHLRCNQQLGDGDPPPMRTSRAW